MLNKDCKNQGNINNIISKNPRSKIKKTSTNSDKQKGTAKSSKNNKMFRLLVVIWLIPVFISVYLLYLQYKQYVKNNKIRTAHSENDTRLSREQIRNLRRQFNSRQESENHDNDNSKKANIYLIKVNRSLGRAFLKPIKTDITLNREEIDLAMKKLIEFKINERLKKRDYYSLIPNRTKLLSTDVKNDTLILNFSNSFMEGLSGTQQIKLKAAQIVYTATQFPGIKKVKFNVNNNELKYWGGEGVFTSSILTRSDVPRIMAIN